LHAQFADVPAGPLVENAREKISIGLGAYRFWCNPAVLPPHHDWDELNPPSIEIPEGPIDADGIFCHRRCHCTQQIGLNAVTLKTLNGLNYSEVATAALSVLSEGIMQPFRSIETYSDFEAFFSKKRAPTVVEKGAVGLKIVPTSPSLGKVLFL
jgi:hypothetical protein